MLKGITENGELKNIKVTEDGEVLVKFNEDGGDEGGDEGGDVVVPEVETTLMANVVTVGDEESTISVNAKVTSIDIANYSETADITLTIGELEAEIGSNIAATIVVNKEVTDISLISTEDDTKVQLIIKGVEENGD